MRVFLWLNIRMNKYSSYLAELYDTKVPYTVIRARSDAWVANAVIGKNVIEFTADEEGEDTWDVAFAAKGFGSRATFGLTNDGVELQVFAFVKTAFEEFVSTYQPHRITFTADKDGGSDTRSKLYQRMVQRFASSKGYRYEVKHQSDSAKFLLTRH